ncbi:hypothetical protein FISHEDRAFT_40768 [Fistulina hepatica ATCC 64428]|uniref:Protein MON2 homolog n=1 Tax=Fistulina hepatica ATCC 64428 TaxID=1128425 RepID=A0A0D7AE02_9AGAR|nr:hypothetical protein FISHEDRAFT_40768 [Fistulina hepatica ATCC 64428]
MSSLAFLVTELQSLASETRRKHPEIREAAEKSLAILRASPEQATANLASDGPQTEDLLRPVFMGCATRNAKVVAISLGSLQRLIGLRAVPQSAVPLIIQTMNDSISQGVDIQLRILQTLLSLITNFPAVHGELLGDALLLCFKLHESKIAVVSSTAAATLRQLVMFVIDKMSDEDRREDEVDTTSEVDLPNGSRKAMGPSAHDAFCVFEDLCLLANFEKPHFLKLESLHKTFALELIESVLSNYHDVFRKHPEFVLLLRRHLCPLLLKGMSERPMFALTLRCTRVVFILLKKFSFEIQTEVEVFLMLLIKIIAEDTEVGTGGLPGEHVPPSAPRPQWMRVLAMEIMRGLCTDPELIRNIWDRYDGQEAGSNVFSALVTTLNRLVSEKPALLGAGAQMSGLGIGSEDSASTYNLTDVGSMAGMVASAASATVSGVVNRMGAPAGLSVQSSAMKLQCIDQLDKADSPPIPESYVYLLGVQCVILLCEGFASFTGPLYNSIVFQRPRAAGETIVRAPPALNFSALPANEPSTKQLTIVRDCIENGWPALLAALSFIISTNLSDDLFADVLASYQAMTNVSGMLGLLTSRDAFFNSLAKFSVPTRVVTALNTYTESVTPRTPGFSENLGLVSPLHAPTLSERNMACLKAFIACSMFLAGSLGDSWFNILEVLQNAEFVLSSKAGLSRRGSTNISRSASGSSSTVAVPVPAATASRPAVLKDLDAESLFMAIQRLFDASKNLEDLAFHDFVAALCRLSAEMVSMQGEGDTLLEFGSVENFSAGFSPKSDQSHKRRVSTINIPRTLRSDDFGIAKLDHVALLNIHRLVYRSTDVAWDAITTHLLAILRLSTAPQSIRVQAAQVLDNILVRVPRNITSTGNLQAKVQSRVLDVLSHQVIMEPVASSSQTSTIVELRRMGLETLHQILQSSGHTLVVGWETIFEMLASVCRVPPLVHSSSGDSTAMLSSPPLRSKPMLSGLSVPSEKSQNALVKIAFQSLTLVCDSVSALSPAHLRLCISTLGQFGRQADTNIALTAAASLLWSVSDAIQTKRKNVQDEPEYSTLWMFLLVELLGLGTDPRPEVRDGAIQTLFRTMQLYGATLSLETWDQCLWKVIFPLLDALTAESRALVTGTEDAESAQQRTASEEAWDDSKTLALHSLSSILHDFLVPKVVHLDSFVRAWDTFVDHIQDAVLRDSRTISVPALRCLERSIEASLSGIADLRERIDLIWERAWKAVDAIGAAVLRRLNVVPSADAAVQQGPHEPFTQDSLVALVDVIRSTRKISRAISNREWDVTRLKRLLAILKGMATYPSSPDFRPDVESLSPLQSGVMDTILEIDLSVLEAASLIMQDLAEFATLAFLAAFDVPQLPKSSTPPKRVTYIALTKRTMPLLVDLFLQFKDMPQIFSDGTVEAILSAYSIPMKLKYDCPPASKFGKDLPLWKTASNNFLRVVKECGMAMERHTEEIPGSRVEGVWRQALDVFRGGILADCSFAETLSLEEQEAEENFDLSLVAALEIDVVPYIGDVRLPDDLVASLSRMLHRASMLYNTENETSSPVSSEFEKINIRGEMRTHNFEDNAEGKTTEIVPVPRERFSYWCFDLLFLICSNMTNDREHSRRRLAALSLPSLLNRCQTTMVDYVADEQLRGNLPFPRVREEELIYILRKLASLRLWPGTLWAALSDEPTKYCVEPPGHPSKLVVDVVRRSSLGHLFQLYNVLCDISSIPRRTPFTSVKDRSLSPSAAIAPQQIPSDYGEFFARRQAAPAQVDARDLARECLKLIGKEMGLPS